MKSSSSIDGCVGRNGTLLSRHRGYRRAHHESAEMVKLAQWLDGQGVLWCHVPNEGVRHPRTAQRLKAYGLKAGVPDVLVFARLVPWVNPPAHVLADVRGWALELKRPEGGQESKRQSAWLADLKRVGWHVYLAHSAAEAIDWFKQEWGSND